MSPVANAWPPSVAAAHEREIGGLRTAEEVGPGRHGHGLPGAARATQARGGAQGAARTTAWGTPLRLRGSSGRWKRSGGWTIPTSCAALDAREVDGIRFLVMEHVDGLDLAEVVARCGPLSVADACEAARQAALGLECSAEHGLVHRDIKPSNLMLSAEGHIKILDLGLAQFQEVAALESGVTGIGQVMGTPDYMSPEQALESHTVDIRTDIYSLGCTLYYLLAGQPPFSGSQYDTLLKKVTGHLRDAVPSIAAVRPDLPRPLVALLERMLAKDTSQRVARPSEVVSALAPLCAGSKLIGLLRAAQAAGKQAAEEPAHEEAMQDELSPRPQPEEPAAASAAFDPYHRWLGIPPEEQPADHYRLLGIARFERDPEVIRDAATRQMGHVRTLPPGSACRVVAADSQRAGGGQGVSLGSAEESGLRCRAARAAARSGLGNTRAACACRGADAVGHRSKLERRDISRSRATPPRCFFVASPLATGPLGSAVDALAADARGPDRRGRLSDRVRIGRRRQSPDELRHGAELRSPRGSRTSK